MHLRAYLRTSASIPALCLALAKFDDPQRFMMALLMGAREVGLIVPRRLKPRR